jgi:hypothetical protein
MTLREWGLAEWPSVFQITLSNAGGDASASYCVLTRMGEHKAVAMAVEFHALGGHAWQIYRVNVVLEGPAPRTESGLVGDVKGCLEDRNES